MLNRRQFLTSSALCGVASLLPWQLLANPSEQGISRTEVSDYTKLVDGLLQDWCNGMLKHQIVDESNPELHGALWCPACQKIHGRCMDAVYPFMHMAHKTGNNNYLNAAILLMQWSKNVSKDDGSWTVIPDPKSWAGITVFGAIAVAEALHYHGDILPKQIEKEWRLRLAHAAEYLYKNFDLEFTNINYGGTAIYAFLLIGQVLNDSKYIQRSHELAKGIEDFFTQPNHLLFGEGKPSRSRSVKGLLPVDLGYNVEETLNSLVMYALHENDRELLQLLESSLQSHLEFMLPDGAWDNSWGTRQAKWSYWGSRTTDGSQPAYALMAHINPAFASAAYLNTELLARCTADGLLHGGLHYVSHGVKPCIHHTFAHAKPLAYLLDNSKVTAQISKAAPIPRVNQYGVKHFSELDVWLVSSGNWKATISSYDALYKEGKQDIQQVTGGALGMLWHEQTGPLLVASMPKYQLVEKNNQQPQPDGEDIALTPRIESYDKSGRWFTNLYDLSAKVTQRPHSNGVLFDITTQVKDKGSHTLGAASDSFSLHYLFKSNVFQISASRNQAAPDEEEFSRLVLPVIATSHERVTRLSAKRITVSKPKATMVIESNFPITLRQTATSRVFNMVPGMEAVILDVTLPNSAKTEAICTITVAPALA